MEKGWSELSAEEKRQKRLQNFLNPPPGTEFKDERAARLYTERANRILAADMCQKPDRVPVSLPIGSYPAYYAGYDFKTVMYDYKIHRIAWSKFLNDFSDYMDVFPARLTTSGKALDIMDNLNYAWPGHGIGDNATTYQYKEAEYITAEELKDFIHDSSDFKLRVLTPRTVKALEPLKYFFNLDGILARPLEIAGCFTRPDIREAFRKLIATGEELEIQQKESALLVKESIAAGFPLTRGGMGTAPFDVIADILRGTQGVAYDMYRQPDRVLEAIDVITRLQIRRLIQNVNDMKGYTVNFPLHKGDDKFMSRKQFEKFYWPSLKKTVDALIAEGIMVSLFAEGSLNQRLDYLGDFPKGWVTWLFDQTDMAKAKKMVGNTCGISGNVPASLMVTGTPEQVKNCCRKLIEDCAPGGGYILAGGCSATETKNPDNFRAFMETAEKYGKY